MRAVFVLAVVLAAIVAGNVSAATSAKPVPCKAGQATGAAKCARPWVAAGCNQFVAIAKTVAGTAVTAKKVSLVRGRNGLDCSFTFGSSYLGFLFIPSGETAAVFAADVKARSGITTRDEAPNGCLTSADADVSTATPTTPPTKITGLGDQAELYDWCASGFVAMMGGTGTTSPLLVVRRGATEFQLSGTSAAQTTAFARKLLAKVP